MLRGLPTRTAGHPCGQLLRQDNELAYTPTPGPHGAYFTVPVVDDAGTAISGLAGALKAFLDCSVPAPRMDAEPGARDGKEHDIDPHFLVTHPQAMIAQT